MLFRSLVFLRTKHGCNRLADQLNREGITALAIHGNKSQGARTRALAEFKSGELQVLCATDIAARGIDIDQLPHVVNYDLPNVPEDYVHRIGRTGRAGASGEAVSLVCVDEHVFLRDIESLIKQDISQEVIAGFEPDPKAKAEPILQRQGRSHSTNQSRNQSRNQGRVGGQAQQRSVQGRGNSGGAQAQGQAPAQKEGQRREQPRGHKQGQPQVQKQGQAARRGAANAAPSNARHPNDGAGMSQHARQNPVQPHARNAATPATRHAKPAPAAKPKTVYRFGGRPR